MAGDYTLVLDVPNIAAVDSLNVTGRVMDAAGGNLTDVLTARLGLPDGGTTQPVTLDPGGRFLFPDVDLADGNANCFVLTFRNLDGAVVFEHRFDVLFAPDDTESLVVTTVLPRALSIETFDGLVALAEEGVALPARCERTFRKQNDNSSISLRLFQEYEPIGEVRIENIPAAGGRGALVDLVVDVTEKNEVRGTARIRSVSGQVVLEAPVSVLFEMPVIPTVAELEAQYSDLRARMRDIDDEHCSDTAKLALSVTLIGEIDRLLAQQPVDRQEAQVAVRRLRTLFEAPQDQMHPTLAVFCRVAQDCRGLVTQME